MYSSSNRKTMGEVSTASFPPSLHSFTSLL